MYNRPNAPMIARTGDRVEVKDFYDNWYRGEVVSVEAQVISPWRYTVKCDDGRTLVAMGESEIRLPSGFVTADDPYLHEGEHADDAETPDYSNMGQNAAEAWANPDVYAQAEASAEYQANRKAYNQGAADAENGAEYNPARHGHAERSQEYADGWEGYVSWASEASLRYAESGAHLENMPMTAEELQQDAYDRFLDGLAYINAPYDPEEFYERDPFMARVYAYGEEAKRQADAAWEAGAAARKAASARHLQAWEDAIPF